MLEAIISGSAAKNHSERELWAESGELQRPNRLRTTAALEALRHPKTKLSSLKHHHSDGSPAPPKAEFFSSLQLQALLGDRSRGPRGRRLKAIGAKGQCLDFAVISLGRKPFTIEGNVQSAHIACSQHNLLLGLNRFFRGRDHQIVHERLAIGVNREPGIFAHFDQEDDSARSCRGVGWY